MKLKIFLCISAFLFITACSGVTPVYDDVPAPADNDIIKLSITDMTSNMPVDIETAFANLNIDASDAEKVSDNTDYYLLTQKLEIFGHLFDVYYTVIDGKLVLFDFVAMVYDDTEEGLELLKEIYYFIESELGIPETYPVVGKTTIETIIKEQSNPVCGSYSDMWFIDEEDKEEIKLSLFYSCADEDAMIMISCADLTEFYRKNSARLLRRSMMDDVGIIAESTDRIYGD